VTPTKDTAGHPDVTEISDLVEGLLAPDRTAAVSEHLDECVLCADVQASLEEIRGALGTLPGPVRMPADVAGRIDAALAAEALLSTTTAAASPHSRAPADAGHVDTLRAPYVSRETKDLKDWPDGPAGTRPARRPALSGPGRSGGPVERTRARRRRSLGLAAVFAAAAVGIGVFLVQPFQEDAGPPATAAFSGRPLEQQVSGLLAAPGTSGEASSPQPRTLVRPAVDVPACVREGIEDDAEAIAAQDGSFEGKDAYLVVLPDPTSDLRVIAYVVDASCVTESSTSKQGKGDVLLQRSYARPSS
jgi:anti-sigma factor RsiW